MKKLIILLSSFALCFSNVENRPIHIFMIGDSSMSNKSEKVVPETGWGQVLQNFFNDSIVVANYAQNGRSSKSFRDSGLWDSVITKVQKGDYVIIQFGHNDNKPDPKRHTDPYSTFTANLLQYINETKEKGGIPVLCTSIVRRHFNEKGELIDTHGDYVKAVRVLAEQSGVIFIDMEAKTRAIVEKAGPQKSKEFYIFLEPGIYPNRYKGSADSTHLSQLGAYKVASLAVEEIKEMDLPITKFLKNK